MRNKLGKRLFSMLLSTMMVFNMAPVNLTAYAAAGSTPPHTKKLIDNHDGTYTLSLDVVGESERKPNPVNVTVILDHSGSMDKQTGGYGSQTRMAAAQNAVNNLARSLFNYNTTEFPELVEMALVGFSTTGAVTQNPTNSYSTFSGAVNRLDADGGTNWEDALQDAANINYGDTDPTYVIFVSDGNPTFRNTRGNYSPLDNYYYNRYGVYGNGSDTEAHQNIPVATTIARCYDNAVDDARSLATAVGADHFYTIGAYGNVDRMRSLTTDAGAPAGNYFSAANTTDLQNALASILAQIEKAGIGSVEIEDGTTNQVTASSGVVELLEVDTSSFKYYKDGVEWTDAPEAQFVNGAVEWDLSSVGVLDDGVKYTVTFDCYPSQYTYDTIAKLKNGDLLYSELDPEVQKYIVDNGNGTYSLRTNTSATLDWDDTRTDADELAVAYTNPDPVRTDSATMSVSKKWENELDARAVGTIDMTVLMDDDKFTEVTLSDPEWTVENIYISPGIIKNGQVLPGAEGHDFTFAELGPEQYNWELVSPVVHPMLINGTLTMLTLVDDAHPAPSGAQTYTINGKTYYSNGSSAASLDAFNYRRSNLNLTKVVTGEDAPEDATFPFTLKVNNSKAANGSASDTSSDYYVWFSIYDTKAGATVKDATVTGATAEAGDTGYYYAPSGAGITVQMKDGWNLRFTNLPTGTTYTFAEGDLADGFAFNKAELSGGDDSTFSGAKTSTGTVQETNKSYQVTYTNDYQLTDLEITKVWADNNNQDGKRLTADELKAKLTLSPAVNGKEAAVVDNGNNTYTITYTGLPRFNNGEEVEYTVTESAIDGYTTTGSPAKDHGTITNTHTPEVTSVKVTKVWDDENNIGKIRPASINVQLTADGTASGDPVTLNADNKWTYTWENLPKYKDGKEIAYTADETAVPTGYTKTVTGDATTGFTITNTYSPTSITASFPVKKILTVPQGLEGPAEWSYTINVAANNGAPEAETMTGTVTKTADTATFGPIKFTKPGTYTYTVTESGTVAGVTNDAAATTGKTVTVTVEDDGTGKLTVKEISSTEAAPLTFTNTYSVAPVTASFPVQKILSVPTGMTGPATWSYTINAVAEDGAPAATTMTGTVDQDNDTVTFGDFTYTAPGTYTYKVTENGEVAGVTNDAAATTGKTVTVTVVDNGKGVLTATASSTTESPLTFTNTYGADPATASFPVKKILSVPAGMTGPATWSFDITVSAEEGVPVAETMTGKVSNTQDTVAFGPITYTAPGTYTYTVTESGTVAGVTNDAAATTGKTVTVTVEDDGTGELTVKEISSTEAAPLTFTNVYGAKPVTAKFPVQKILSVPEGMSGPETWSYTIDVKANDGAPEAETMTGTVDQDNDTVTFGDFTYETPGTYTYTVSETGTVAGVTNDGDAAGKTVTVTVVDNGDGTLTATPTSTDEDPLTFTNTYSVEPTTAEFPVKKILSVPEGMSGPETWSYTINVVAEDGAPAATTMTGTVDQDNDTVTFGDFTYTAPGTYTYTVSETGTVAGVTNDGDAAGKTVTVTVVDNGDGTLTATPTSTDDEPLTFTNTYSVGEITTSFPVKKIMSVPQGLKGPAEWSYTIDVAANDGAPEAETMTGTVTNAADTATFGPITYTAPGTYTYTVSETGKVAGVTNDGDAAGKTVTVTVKDNGDGTLTASADATAASPLTFTNTYSVEPTTAKFPVEKIMSVPEGLTGPAEWSYTIDVEANAGAPEAETMTAAIDQDNKTATFGDFTYEAPGTYTYTVSETGEVAGVTNDKDAAGKTVTVTVVDNGDGTLTATPTSTDDEPLTFTNTYSVEPTTAEFPVEKIMSKAVESMTGPEDWSYDIKVAAEDGAPEAETMTGTVTKAAPKATFGGFSFTAPGTYKYTVTETGSVKGVTNDPEAETGKTVTVNVTDNGNGTLTASPSSAEKNPLTFTNTYDIEPTEKITLEVTKELKGRDWEEGETYEFELLDESGEPLGTASASNANPVAAFAPITYTAKDLEKGKFTYTIREIEPDQKGEPYCYVTYDKHKVTATVTLTDNGNGTMSANVTYAGKTTFTNVYEDTTYTVTKVWDDADNRLRIRPDDLTVTVYAMISGDMLFSREVVLNDSNDWTMKLENLPAKYMPTKHNGYEIEYIAEEAEVTGYSNATASDAKRMEFVNTTDTGDLSIKKFVNKATEEFDKNDTTDYDFTVTVETEDTETFDQNVTFYTAKANSSDGETTGEITFRNGEAKFTLHSDEIVRIVGLPAGATYKVEESVDASRNYDPVFFNNEGTIIKGKVQYVTFINRELDERTLKVQKSWENDSDFAEYRPEKITVDIYKIQGDEEKLYAKGVDLLKTNGYAEVFNLDGYDAVATVSDATRSSANTSASTANAKKASASTASSSSASFSDAAVADAFDEDGNLKDGTIFDDLFTVVKDAVKEAAGKIGTLFGIDDDTEISFRVEETKVPDHYKVTYDEYDTENHILTFTNTREDANKVWIDPPVEKIISVIRGTITRDETFTFRMTQLNGTTMFPKGAKVKTDDDGYPYMELKITGEGEKEFGKIYYDKVGTYVYEITEVNTGASNYSYSTDSYLVTAEVTADRDKLVENVTVVKNGTDEVFTIKTSDGIGGDVLGIQFVNTYDAGNRGGSGNGGGGGGRRGRTPSTPVEPGSPVLPEVPVPGALPKTGESSGKAVPMLFAMLAMFGALFGFKKRDDEDEQ